MKFTVTALREANTQTEAYTDEHTHSWTLSINKRESKKQDAAHQSEKIMHTYYINKYTDHFQNRIKQITLHTCTHS